MHVFFLVAGLVVGQALATGWQMDAKQYSSPYNTNNKCSTDQKIGYNWDNLEPGSFGSYGSNKFSGFKCGNSFGKRDGITKRTFQDKCITADIDKEPKIECDGKDKMTIDSYQVSSSWDTDVEAHHEMPDGSTCKQIHRCTKGGNTVQNTQCAGSKTVTFKPKQGESGKNEKGESCSIGIHSIDFKCEDNSPSSTQPAYSASTSSSASQPTSEAETTASVATSYGTTSDLQTLSSYGSASSEVPTTSTTKVSPETTSVTSVPAFSSYTNVSSTLPVESSVGVPTSYAVTDSSLTGATSSSTSGSLETSTAVGTSSTTSTEVAPESTPPTYESPPIIPSNSSVPAYSATTSSQLEVPTQTYETPDTPDLLPKCVNTWIGQTDCKDNTDSSCYCRDADLIKKVMGCIEAWSDDDAQTQSAASYLQGVCAEFIPDNVAIITACPSAGKPSAAPVTESSSAETPEETAPIPDSSSTEASTVTTTPAEMTTSTVYATTVSTITSCAADVTDCPAASQTIAVVTKTVAVSTTICPVSVAGTPASSTDVSPEDSSAMPSESLTATTVSAEPSTLTYYSTSPVTITSCAEDVTDCPASSTIVSEIPVSYTVVETPEASSPASPEQTTSAIAPTGEAPAPSTSEVPAITSPVSAPGSAGPSTVITYSSSIQVPCTYSTGESYGQEIPGSSEYATIDTTLTVPQVVFVTSTITAPGSTGTISVGLVAGSPSPVPAYPTPTANAIGGSAKPTGSTGFGTSYIPGSTGSPITPFEGSASVARTGVISVVIGVAVAIFAM